MHKVWITCAWMCFYSICTSLHIVCRSTRWNDFVAAIWLVYWLLQAFVQKHMEEGKIRSAGKHSKGVQLIWCGWVWGKEKKNSKKQKKVMQWMKWLDQSEKGVVNSWRKIEAEREWETRNHQPYVICFPLFSFLSPLIFKLPSLPISLFPVALPVSPNALSPEQD